MLKMIRLRKVHFALVLVAGIVALMAFQPHELVNTTGAVSTSQFMNFESAHVHPVDMTPDGTKVLAVNTANNTLEVFQVTGPALLNVASIPVGLDPVTVRVRSNTEAWVVDQVSDEISVVDLTQNVVVRSIQTEDEPADVVFAGSPQRAFVSCAGRESIQVFDPANPGTAPTEVLLKGEQPRALAVSNNGNTVYCAFFESGNATTVLNGNDFFNFQHGTFSGGAPRKGICSPQGGCTVIPNEVTNPAGPYGGAVSAAAGIVPNAGAGFNPPLNPNNPPTTDSKSIIVRKNASGQWLDDNGSDWTNLVSGTAPGKARIAGWDMPDRDVAVIDANAPSTANVTYQTRLGNILMAMAVNPATGQVNVVGTDATNEIRFEPVLNGKFLRVNLSQFGSVGGPNTITDLNNHLTYSAPSVPPAQRKLSLGDPRGIAFTSDGTKAFITGMGSNNVVVINADGTRALPNPIAVGEGPTGIVLNSTNTRAYVLNKFEGTISTVDLTTNREIARSNFYDPTPLVIKAGRKHLYNTHLGSGTGHIACGSCHVDGRWDRLGWDLGNPAGAMETVSGKVFHPLKGVKTTQFLIDIIDRGRGNLHWRGDKGGFADFAGAFQHLQGMDAPKPANEMQEFEDFLAATWYVPNPFRTLRPETESSTIRLNPNRVRGIGTTFQAIPAAVNLFVSVQANCSHCHNAQTGRGELAGNGNVAGTGAGNLVDFGPNRNMSADLRSTYRKNGFFYNTTECNAGFGMMSEGVMETWFNGPGVANYLGDYEPELLSWSGGINASNSPQSFNTTNFPLANSVVQDALPAVGFRETINGTAVGSTTRINLIKGLANDRPTEYGLIVKGVYQGQKRGFYYVGSDNYQSDDIGQTVTHAQLIAAAQAGGSPLSWTLVGPQTKVRMGVDQDGDGIFDAADQVAQVNARAILEGAYDGTVMRGDLVAGGHLPATDPFGMGATASPAVMAFEGLASPVDWAVLELRDAVNGTTTVASRAVLIQRSGNLMLPSGEQNITFPGAAAGNYHLVLKHRNHLGVMTAQPLQLVQPGTMLDLTLPATPTYGTDARRNVNGTMVLWAGDPTGDGILKYTGGANDRDPVLLRIGGVVPTSTLTGYWPEDVNLDGVVRYTGSGNDRDPILQNIGGVIPTTIRQEQLP
ncbi:MAG: beta-propeller fold lactonase family protein [Flavobacteriales bacterium]|nr:beta-propeller fold lactonase family protein [Flavobacteriales bacterium]